jgi:hypothetical protein
MGYSARLFSLVRTLATIHPRLCSPLAQIRVCRTQIDRLH